MIQRKFHQSNGGNILNFYLVFLFVLKYIIYIITTLIHVIIIVTSFCPMESTRSCLSNFHTTTLFCYSSVKSQLESWIHRHRYININLSKTNLIFSKELSNVFQFPRRNIDFSKLLLSFSYLLKTFTRNKSAFVIVQ